MQEQTPTGDDLLQFNKEYYSFNMAVIMSDGKLNIKVCDFVDWIHYGKQFTEANIGAEIHKKVDLEDVYFSLALNKDNEPKDKQEPEDYTFGDIIKNGQRECFKLEKGGKLTVYTPGIDSKTGKQIYHESKLNLKQVRSMTQMQILSQKMLGQKRQHSKKFQCQLEQLKQQCSNLRQQYKKLQHQNVNLSQQLSSTKQQIAIIKQQQMKTNEQIKVNREEFKKYNEELLNKIKQLTQENNKYKQSLMKEINKNKDSNSKELQSLQIRYKKDVGQIMNKINIFSLGQIYQNKFKIYLNSHIQYSGQNGAFTHFIFNQKIIFNTPYTFRIKILKTVSRYIMIGVVDFNKQKDQRSSYGSGNAVCYYGCNGYKYGQATTEGAGFSEGEVVEINVNLAAKLIKWSVAGTQRASCTLDLLGDQSRVFMPFVQMYNTNDIIQWYFD